MDQEKVFQVVRARARWSADEDQRRAATAHAVATQQWQCATGSCVLRAGDTVLARPAVRVILPEENAVETESVW